ncbi:glutamic acid-rich protein-like [Helianthus annuus]|uniref:glutamic acid-rich protein-like n=1 Tax=Helianthus annuus TaxID=4232 RepID=UPI0016533680|nr:glutamic acid-rich protein-like [Helianthus annuus]
MIGKIKNLDYVAPKNDAWRHENINSEDKTDSLRGMHEKKLRFWFEKDGKRKRTPKVSPKVATPKIVIKEPTKKKSPPWLVDEPVTDPTDLVQQGVDLRKMTLDDFVKQSEAAKAAKEAAKEAETSAKNVEAESLKEKEVEGVVRTDSSATISDSSDTEPRYDTSKLGVGKIKLKVKPQKKKKGLDEEDATYIPTPEEKKKLWRKRRAHPSGVIPRNVRARKGAATMSEIQSAKAPEVEKFAETTSIPEVEKDQSVEKPEVKSKKAPESPYMGERKSMPPASPINPTIHIQDDPKKSPEKKDTSSGSFDGFPKVHGEFSEDLPKGDYDMFHDGKIKVLTKKVSILEKEKEKAEAERDELKEKIDELTGDLGEHAKVIDRITEEFDEVNAKYENMNEVNKTLHQMIGELHESSSNESKVLRQEIEALRADKVVKDEQLNMLYTVMEHKLGINVQAMYNDLEIERVEARRVQREKELAEEATQKKKSVVIDNEEILGSSSQQVQPEAEGTTDPNPLSMIAFGDVIDVTPEEIKLDRRKIIEKRHEEEEKLKNEELKELFDDLDNYDPDNDNDDDDDDDDQGAIGLLVVKPNVNKRLMISLMMS